MTAIVGVRMHITMAISIAWDKSSRFAFATSLTPRTGQCSANPGSAIILSMERVIVDIDSVDTQPVPSISPIENRLFAASAMINANYWKYVGLILPS